MRVSLWIGPKTAPSLGDVRMAGAAHIIWLRSGATERRDWGRYQDAIAQAVARGADVQWVR